MGFLRPCEYPVIVQKEVLETLEAKGVIVDSDRERFAETMKQAGIDFIGDAR